MAQKFAKGGNTASIAKDRVEPRVMGSTLAQYSGQTVRLVGRIVEIKPLLVILEAADGQPVNVHTKNGSKFGPDWKIVEVLGIANPDGSLKEVSFSRFENPNGPEFDMGNYYQLLTLMQNPACKEIFSNS